MYSNTKYYYFWNKQGIRKHSNLPISQKKGCERLEFAISPEYLSIKMNYCLLLSDSMVNVVFSMEELHCVSCWILFHRHCLPGKAISSRDSSRPTQAWCWVCFWTRTEENHRWCPWAGCAHPWGCGSKCREMQGHPTCQNQGGQGGITPKFPQASNGNKPQAWQRTPEVLGEDS